MISNLQKITTLSLTMSSTTYPSADASYFLILRMRNKYLYGYLSTYCSLRIFYLDLILKLEQHQSRQNKTNKNNAFYKGTYGNRTSIYRFQKNFTEYFNSRSQRHL